MNELANNVYDMTWPSAVMFSMLFICISFISIAVAAVTRRKDR